MMQDQNIRTSSLWIAGSAGALAAADLVFPALHPSLLPATAAVAFVASLLFMRVLFSRFYRQGIDQANRDMRGDAPWPGKPIKFSDPVWGLFGVRTGDRNLCRVRAVLLLGGMPLVIAQHWVGMAVVELWWAGMFVALILSVMFTAIVSNQQNR